MREPVFNETVQLGIVVRDLEATVRRYEGDKEAVSGQGSVARSVPRPMLSVRPSGQI